MKFLIVIFLTLLSINSFAGGDKPLALVWKGGGTCFMWCAPAAKKIALKSGLRVKYVNSRTKNLDGLLQEAKVWIQPGGLSLKAAKMMGPDLMSKVREFVYRGGGYVGFCAGMLLASETIGESDTKGLGIIPGNTVHLMKGKKDIPYVLDIILSSGEKRDIYFSGGPYLELRDETQVKIIGRYSSGEIAAIETKYGDGLVSVAGYHPETPRYWKILRGKKDRDGSDYDLAIQMIKNVTNS